MFDRVQAAPPDAILGLSEAFQADSNPAKINLAVGQYKDANGATPILECVKQAEERLIKTESSKGYLGIVGHADYRQHVPGLLLGADHPFIAADRISTLQTPGGTGALRVAADFLHTALPDSTVWLSDPTWPNHPNIFAAAGVPTSTYEYYDAENFALNSEAMMASLAKIPAGDVVLLHGCCHNPSGVDLQPEHWQEVAKIVKDRGLIPLVDFAYQGFGDGIEEDAGGLRTLCESAENMIVCSSFSKNFGLYCERIGAMSLISGSAKTTAAITSRAKKCVRANYSNPPAHGAAIVASVLGDKDLTAKWHEELAEMRNRINGLRQSFADEMKRLESPRSFAFITRQRGMFSFSGLTADQVAKLKAEHSIYVVNSGRINVAGMTDANLKDVCAAVRSVI